MNTYAAPWKTKVPTPLAVLGVVAIGAAGVAMGTALTDQETRSVEVRRVAVAPNPIASPSVIEGPERARMIDVVDRMPAGWPATEVMRRELDAQLLDVVDRMPAGWPATEVMRRAAEAGS